MINNQFNNMASNVDATCNILEKIKTTGTFTQEDVRNFDLYYNSYFIQSINELNDMIRLFCSDEQSINSCKFAEIRTKFDVIGKKVFDSSNKAYRLDEDEKSYIINTEDLLIKMKKSIEKNIVLNKNNFSDKEISNLWKKNNNWLDIINNINIITNK